MLSHQLVPASEGHMGNACPLSPCACTKVLPPKRSYSEDQLLMCKDVSLPPSSAHCAG